MNEPSQDALDLALDSQKNAWQTGRRPSIDDLLRDASLTADLETILDLLYNKIVVREEIGESPSLKEYVDRYPEFEEELRVQFEVHQAVRENLLVETRRVRDSESFAGSGVGLLTGPPKFANYEIAGELGRGGMGVVYKAHHRGLKRFVALKILQAGRVPSPRDLARFRAEAEAIARLQHPNIVQIYDVGQEQGIPFLALELAENGTLQQKLQDLPYQPRAAAELIETLARASHHAHLHHVIHRDLKPANVLFTADGTPKIADFGLAKLLEPDADDVHDATRTGEPIGTPRYMAPEQASGNRDAVGPATDVYALGTLLYECLTGRAPFVSPTVVETVDRIRHDEPVPPRRLQRAIPRDLETICLNCLAKEPARRYASALDLAEDLGRFLRGEPIKARRTVLWRVIWMWCRRRPALATWIAASYLVVTAGVTWAFVHRNLEFERIKSLRESVQSHVKEGQLALARGEGREAKEHFQAALAKIQSEPTLSDHELGVRGWLDHSHQDAQNQRYSHRRRPLLFDERRDDAFLQAFFVNVHEPESVQATREAIAGALEFALPKDPAWRLERESLLVLDASLALRLGDASGALAILDRAQGFTSRAAFFLRSECLRTLGRISEAEENRVLATNLVPRIAVESLFQGISHWHSRHAEDSIRRFDEALMLEPDFFLARVLQSASFLKAKRPGEAEVGLTACLAERPRFTWCLLLRGQAHTDLGEFVQAAQDFQAAWEAKPNSVIEERLRVALHAWSRALAELPRETQERIWNAEIRTVAGRSPLRAIDRIRPVQDAQKDY